MNARITSLGFVEVKGLSCAIAVADAMLKSSSVCLYAQMQRDPAQITIVVEGDLGACDAAVTAGAEVARGLDALVGVLVKGKPDIAIEALLREQRSAAQKVAAPIVLAQSAAPAAPAPSTGGHEDYGMSERTLLVFLADAPGGCTVSVLAAHFKTNVQLVRTMLNRLEREQKIERSGKRFRVSSVAA
ncbi:BMC domain-containing protein [Noviherbaspirillum saxi]|uniref:BMC domain-containing protein n=1 Tax=Noviherbaspirillum saxi TaxID=2320863 RepID=A0A3A3FFD2_9BURK|nr:BMC domain-containing protein [Noviherbaspirillum saxi]RJF92056.1 BMC domain-containing protein [Noviherbaspirillum saxi]